MKSSNPITDYLLHASNFLPAIVFLFYGRLGPEQPDVRWTHAFLMHGWPGEPRPSAVLTLAAGGGAMSARGSLQAGRDMRIAWFARGQHLLGAWSSELGHEKPPGDDS